MAARGGERILVRWPTWLDRYEAWHPLVSTAYDLYKAEAFARDAGRYRACRAALTSARANLRRFEDAGSPQRRRVAAGERAAEQFNEARDVARERKAQREQARRGPE